MRNIEPYTKNLEILKPYAENHMLKPDAASLFRKNTKVYMAYKEKNRGDIAENSDISKDVFNSALRGDRGHRNLEDYVVIAVADALGIDVKQLVTEQLLYFDPLVRYFLDNKSYRSCTKVLMDCLEKGNEGELVLRIKYLLEITKTPPIIEHKLEMKWPNLSEKHTSVFKSNLPLFLAYNGISFGDVCRKMGKDYNKYRRRLTGQRVKSLPLSEVSRIAKTVDAEIKEIIAPLLLDMDASLKKFVLDSNNLKRVYALMDYINETCHPTAVGVK